jgi:lysophospholipase-2
MSEKPPYIVPPTAEASSTARPATLIFLHGYGDDADGLPLGLAQQFQFYNKMQYLKWVLPYAPHNQEAMTRAWYVPRALPNVMKHRVPGEGEDEDAQDDETGIMKSVDIVDRLVEQEIQNGTPPQRIVVGGFSQGCAVSLVWGLTGRLRNKVAGVLSLSGYLPLRDRIAELRKERAVGPDEKDTKQWFYAHGTMDMLVPLKLFVQGNEDLAKWVDKENVDGRVYQGMGHSTNSAELRDMLAFFEKVIPA